MNTTRNEARSGVALSRALKLSALGLLTVSALACGDATPANSTPHIGSSGGTSSNTSGGSTAAAGTNSSAGTTGIAGTFGVAGSDSTGGGGATGTAGTGAGGTTPVTQPFCSPLATPVQPRAPLPFAVTNAFYPSGYEGGDPGMNGGGQIAAGACTDRSPTMIGGCSKYTYTPATPATWAGVAYNRGYNGFGSTGHAPVCLADGATAITFYAKGAVGGEVVGFSGGTAMAQTITLTNAWALYTISVSGLQYNTDATGLEDGFFWKVAPVGSVGVLTSFYVDSIQYVGSPGTGGTGGTGGSGGAAAGTGGTGGAAAGSGGTGGA